MGIDLILAMVVAGMITRAYENSKRRSAAAWQEARQAAAEHRAEREQARTNARAARKRRMTKARKTGPSDPMWWPFAAGWLAAALGRGAAAAVKGAREGAQTGATEGYRIGKERAHQRRARRRREEAAYRNGHRAGREDGRTEAERDQAERGQRPGPERDMVPCPRCGVYVADPAACTCTTTATAGDPASTPDRGQGGRPAEQPDSSPVQRPLAAAPDMAITTGTAGNTAASTAAATASAAPAGTTSRPREPSAAARGQPAPSGRPAAAAIPAEFIGQFADLVEPGADSAVMPPAGGRQPEVIDAEIVSDPNVSTNEPATTEPRAITEGNQQMSGTDMQAISVNGAGLSGGDGEGYASTIAAMDQIKGLINRINGVVTDLGDTLTSMNVDQTTTGYLSELDDLLQSAETTVEQARNHAQQKHEPVAAAITGAGGSAEVADTPWYDDL